MSAVFIYGSSDDLIELEGDLHEEFGAYGETEPGYLAFSDGTVLSIIYANDGCWRINAMHRGTAAYTKTEAVDADSPDYSDHVTLVGNLTWCVYGKELLPRLGPQ